MEESGNVQLRLGPRSYEIKVGSGLLAVAGRLVCERADASHAVVICDRNVLSPHGQAVIESLAKEGLRVSQIVVEPGERSKSVETANSLWEQLLNSETDRQSVVLAVGGGVVGDLAGFAAATFARGLAFFQVPTTLLAQVDSSVGGKVGINLPSAKNMVGVFWQPKRVIIDTDVLSTLGEREYRSGLAEVVKYGVILDADFFAYLESHADELNLRDSLVLRYVIQRCCRIKADIVEEDEREETGARAVLNYGHTFAHAIEAVAGYGELLHGEAVSMGMICASRLAERLGRVDSAFTSRQRKLLEKLNLPINVPNLDHDKLLQAMSRDKKVKNTKLRFILPSRMGHVELLEGASNEDVLAALAD